MSSPSRPAISQNGAAANDPQDSLPSTLPLQLLDPANFTQATPQDHRHNDCPSIGARADARGPSSVTRHRYRCFIAQQRQYTVPGAVLSLSNASTQSQGTLLPTQAMCIASRTLEHPTTGTGRMCELQCLHGRRSSCPGPSAASRTCNGA